MPRRHRKLPQGFIYPVSVRYLKSTLDARGESMSFDQTGISSSEGFMAKSLDYIFHNPTYYTGSVTAVRNQDDRLHFSIDLRGVRLDTVASSREKIAEVASRDIQAFIDRVTSLVPTDPDFPRDHYLLVGFRRNDDPPAVCSASSQW